MKVGDTIERLIDTSDFVDYKNAILTVTLGDAKSSLSLLPRAVTFHREERTCYLWLSLVVMFANSSLNSGAGFSSLLNTCSSCLKQGAVGYKVVALLRDSGSYARE